MAVLTHIERAEAEAWLAAAGLGPLERLEGVPAGSVNSNFRVEVAGGRRYFLRVYEEQGLEGARREAELLAHLDRRGVPTPSPVGGAVSLLAGKPAAVFPWVEGDARCQAAVTPRDAREVGRVLARIHLAGQGLPLAEGRFELAALRARLSRIARAPAPTLAAQASPLEAALDACSRRRDPSLPRGLIHGDLFRDNVLWAEDGALLAVLDFESASAGVFVYDLMVTVLAWCFGAALEAPLVRAMVTGYREVRPLSEAELRGLHAEGCMAALRFTITRITDYAMREASVIVGDRVVKDWRRFARRLEALEALGEAGLWSLA